MKSQVQVASHWRETASEGGGGREAILFPETSLLLGVGRTGRGLNWLEEKLCWWGNAASPLPHSWPLFASSLLRQAPKGNLPRRLLLPCQDKSSRTHARNTKGLFTHEAPKPRWPSLACLFVRTCECCSRGMESGRERNVLKWRVGVSYAKSVLVGTFIHWGKNQTQPRVSKNKLQ